MIKTGEVIESPLVGHEFRLFGHRFYILQPSRDTGNESLRFEYFAPPRANISEHVHPLQEERCSAMGSNLPIF